MARNRSASTGPAPTELDEVDLVLLRALSQDGRAANTDLAAAAGVAPSTALLRTRALRASGVLRGTRADIDPAAVGRPLQALVAVRLHGHTRAHVDAFRALAPRLPGALHVFHVAGQDDYLIHVAAADADALRALILDRITSHPAVRATQTQLVFEHLHGVGLLDA
ncbi:MAG: Lrp/AsnC family transcriptional regulator [Kineosporiaceae bacterium]|jgi:DNA-binding Lrp family transcriptional regulator